MLLDEPTNGLDVMSTRAVRDIIRRLRDDGRCVLFSSHVMQEVSALCDSIIVIAHGRVAAIGTPNELREQDRTGRASRMRSSCCPAFVSRTTASPALRRPDRRRCDEPREWIGQTLVVLGKELKDGSRDRRALFTLAFSAVVTPALLGFMMNRIAERQRELDEITIPVIGVEHAPALVDWLTQQAGVAIVPGPSDPEAAVRNGQDVVVVISPEFAKKFTASSPAPVKIVSDSSRQTSRPTVQRVRGLLQRYSSEIGSLRLVARGVTRRFRHRSSCRTSRYRAPSSGRPRC